MKIAYTNEPLVTAILDYDFSTAENHDERYTVLKEWDDPAATREGAMMALRLALDEQGNFQFAADMELTASMVRAALGFLGSQS